MTDVEPLRYRRLFKRHVPLASQESDLKSGNNMGLSLSIFEKIVQIHHGRMLFRKIGQLGGLKVLLVLNDLEISRYPVPRSEAVVTMSSPEV